MPYGVVLHCRLCLLVWCLTIGHACWCSTTLTAMPVGVVPHYTKYMLTWYLTIGHTCSSIAPATNIVLVECRWRQDGTNSVATLTGLPLHQRCLLILCHSQIYLLVQSTLSDMHAGFIYSDAHVCKVISSPGKTYGLIQIHQTCLQVRCRSHGFVKLVSYHPGHHLEYIIFRVMHQLHY